MSTQVKSSNGASKGLWWSIFIIYPALLKDWLSTLSLLATSTIIAKQFLFISISLSITFMYSKFLECSPNNTTVLLGYVFFIILFKAVCEL